jgi:hypothetical protein
MKRLEPIENKLIAARHANEGDDVFIGKVMDTVGSRAINSRVMRTTNEQLTKETFIMKLRKLPIAVLIAVIFVAALGLGGISYATVKLIEATRPAVKESRINQNGKTEITIEKNVCHELEKAPSERYELKEGVGLSDEDAAKYINAHCHLLLIDNRLDLSGAMLASGMARGTIASIDGDAVSLKIGDDLYGPLDSSVGFYDKDAQKVARTDFRVGDGVLVYRDMRNFSADHPIIGVFKPIEPLKYYDQWQQQNIRTVKPCSNNETMDCVAASNYNTVILIAARGGSVVADPETSKEIQGKLVEYSADHFTLENNGHRVTFQTPYDIVDRYNRTTVYGLARYDTIYAKTDPEALKMAIGDSLSLYYTATANETTISWDKVGVILLMVEREPSDISVLRKY